MSCSKNVWLLNGDMKKKKPFPCPYCREMIAHNESQKDHVPPQCLFGQGIRLNLITVKCCAKCHRELSHGDDVLRAVSFVSPYRSPEASLIGEDFQRSLKANAKWSRDFFEGVQKSKFVTSKDESGLDFSWHEVPISREVAMALQTTHKRVVIGLVNREIREFNPLELDFFIRALKPDERPIMREILQFAPRKVDLGGNAFHARWCTIEDDWRNGLMIMSFFLAHSVLAVWCPKDAPLPNVSMDEMKLYRV